jgi:predicted nucleic acid-binding protein
MYDTPACYLEWEQLAKRYGVKGKQAHDAKLVASMIAHGIPAILTLNSSDFQTFGGIQILTP